jgi:5-methylthioadenosine/S-adenosylhomocysteine deaminase
VDLRHARSWPVSDVAAALVYSAGAHQVTDAWVAGRQLLTEGALRYVDEHGVLERAEAWRARIDDAGDSREAGRDA